MTVYYDPDSRYTNDESLEDAVDFDAAYLAATEGEQS